ncbi:hypothetical protein UT300016_18070 [Clostridium senegalense]
MKKFKFIYFIAKYIIAGTVPEAIHIPVIQPINTNTFKTTMAFFPPAIDILKISFIINPFLNEMKAKIKNPNNNGNPTKIPL